jgi:hypothetical protein
MAKSRSIGGIYASLSLRDQGFKTGLRNAQKHLGEFSKKAAIGAAAGAGVAGAALVAGAKSTLSMVDDLGDVSNQTGVAVGDMMKLQQAYAMGGRAAEMAGKDIGKMQKSLVEAASGGKNPFEALGLDAQQLLRMDPADQFNTIGEAIMKMSNPAERTAKAMEIFGKAGMGLTTVFEGIPDAALALGKMPEIAAEFADRMGEANDLIGNLPLKSDQFFMGFTAGIVDSIIPGLNDINEFEFTQLGKSLGETLSSAFKDAEVIAKTFWDVVHFRDSTGSGGYGTNKYEEERLAKDLEAQLAVAMKKVDKFHDEKNKKLNQFFPEDFHVPDDVIEKMVKGYKDFDMSVGSSSDYESPRIGPRGVNAYQARGLSLDGNNAGRAVETTNTLLGRIDKRLADAAKVGGLKF